MVLRANLGHHSFRTCVRYACPRSGLTPQGVGPHASGGLPQVGPQREARGTPDPPPPGATVPNTSTSSRRIRSRVEHLRSTSKRSEFFRSPVSAPTSPSRAAAGAECLRRLSAARRERADPARRRERQRRRRKLKIKHQPTPGGARFARARGSCTGDSATEPISFAAWPASNLSSTSRDPPRRTVGAPAQ